MRFLFPLVVLIAVQVGAAQAVSESIGDTNVARPGATFATVEAENAAACARLCADDTLCMAWSFHANACELKAVVPAAIAQDGVTSGVSTRAPVSMRVRFEPPPPAAPAIIEAHEEAAATLRPEDDISLALLGGPETDHDLRLSLRN